eukprot:745298-Pyramimonas_sp.AAC.1
MGPSVNQSPCDAPNQFTLSGTWRWPKLARTTTAQAPLHVAQATRNARTRHHSLSLGQDSDLIVAAASGWSSPHHWGAQTWISDPWIWRA